MIQVDNINIDFDGKSLLSDISFHVSKGEKFCLYGPSGKGKTTILNALMGFVTPNSGSISINNIPMNPANCPCIRESMSWLPQNINLPVNNGKELVQDFLQLKNTEKIFDYFDLFGLEKDVFTRNINQISGGQKQRMILSVILLFNRPILILDEPTSALDDDSIDGIINGIFNLKDITVISSSHNKAWIDKCDSRLQIL